MPIDFANLRVGPSPAIIQWAVSSITALAKVTAFLTQLTPAIAPIFRSLPLMMHESISTAPSSLSTDPVPASNAGSSSRTRTAISQASTAEAPFSKAARALDAALITPCLLASSSLSGIAHAPP